MCTNVDEFVLQICWPKGSEVPTMKKLECIIPFKKFSEIEKALRNSGIGGLTVTEVKGYGNEQTRPESYLLLPKVKLEVFCKDEQVNDLVDLLCAACKSKELGAGKIAIYDILDLVRIRTGECGEVAV